MEDTSYKTKIILSSTVFSYMLCGLWWKPKYMHIISFLIGMSHIAYNGINTWVVATMKLGTIAKVSVPMADQLSLKLPFSSRFLMPVYVLFCKVFFQFLNNDLHKLLNFISECIGQSTYLTVICFHPTFFWNTLLKPWIRLCLLS